MPSCRVNLNPPATKGRLTRRCPADVPCGGLTLTPRRYSSRYLYLAIYSPQRTSICSPILALPWSVFFGYSACISLYPACACISLYPDIYLYLVILQHIHCIPLYPLYLAYVSLYPAVSAVSAVSRCISPYLTASKTGYKQKYTPGGGSFLFVFPRWADPRRSA